MNSISRIPTPSGSSINVKDFGAIGDGKSHKLKDRYNNLTDAQSSYPFLSNIAQLDEEVDWAAIQSSIWAVGTPEQPTGTTIVIPQGIYLCSNNLQISRQIMLVGSGRAVTQLKFNASYGIIVDNSNTSPDGGDGTYSTIMNLDVLSEYITIPTPDDPSPSKPIDQWQANKNYAKDDLVRAPNDNRYYYECIRPGKSRATADLWKAMNPYAVGDVVSPGIDFFFECIADGKTADPASGKSGDREPIWDLSVDGITLDGTEFGEDPNMKWQRYLLPPPPAKLKGQWLPNNSYNTGDIIKPTAVFTDSLFYQCTQAVGSGDSPNWSETLPDGIVSRGGVLWHRYPVFPTTPDTINEWQASKKYRVGNIVKSPALVAAGTLVIFECVEGFSGSPNEPGWKTTISTEALKNIKANPADPTQTVDNEVVWVCRSAQDFWIKDDGVVWACRLAAGIWVRTRAYLHNILISNFTCAGVHLQSQTYPSTNLNSWHIDHVACYQCGVGVAVAGGDTNGGTGISIEVIGSGIDSISKRIPGNGGFAIYDRGASNSWIGCVAEACIGRPYTFTNTGAQSVLLGCYSEGGQPPSYLSAGAMALGGVDGAGWAAESLGWTVRFGGDVQPFIVRNFPGDETVALRVGIKDSSNTILDWRAKGNSNYRFRWDSNHKIWVTEADIAGNISSAYQAGYLTGSEAYSRGTGLQGFEKFLLGAATGSPELPIKVTALTEPPSPNYNAEAKVSGQPKFALYQRGDIIFNAVPKPYDPADPGSIHHYVGWVCVDASDDNNQVWKGFGKIES